MGGHQSHQARLLGRAHDEAQRLPDGAPREVGEHALHQLDALVHRQQPLDLVVAEDEQLAHATIPASSSRGAALSSSSVAARAVASCSGRRGPTTTEVTCGWESTHATARVAGSTPRSAAAVANASSPRKVTSFTRSAYGSGRSVIREPEGYASPRR